MALTSEAVLTHEHESSNSGTRLIRPVRFTRRPARRRAGFTHYKITIQQDIRVDKPGCAHLRITAMAARPISRHG